MEAKWPLELPDLDGVFASNSEMKQELDSFKAKYAKIDDFQGLQFAHNRFVAHVTNNMASKQDLSDEKEKIEATDGVLNRRIDSEVSAAKIGAVEQAKCEMTHHLQQRINVAISHIQRFKKKTDSYITHNELIEVLKLIRNGQLQSQKGSKSD